MSILGAIQGDLEAENAERRRQRLYQLASAQEQAAAEQEESDGGGLLDDITGAIGGALEPAGRALSALSSGVVAGAKQLGEGARELAGKENSFGLDTLRSDFNRRIGVGDILEENTLTTGMPLNLKRGLGLVGDIAVDPLNSVTFGGGTAAKNALAKAGAVIGDDVAKAAIRKGGVEGLRQAMVDGGVMTLEEALEQGTSKGLSRLGTDAVEAQLDALARRGKGGIGAFGRSSGLGQNLFDTAASAARQSPTGQALRKAFVPGARVADELGEYGAKAADAAVAGAHAERRSLEQMRHLDPEKWADVDDATFDKFVKRSMQQRMADDFRKLAPTKIGPDGKLPKVVQDMLSKSANIPPSEITKSLLEPLTWVKRQITLGPLNAFPHVTRNITTNKMFAAMFGGVRTAAPYIEAQRLGKAIRTAFKDAGGEVTKEGLEKAGLSGLDVDRALAWYDQGIVSRGSHVIEDLDFGGGGKAFKAEPKGTRTASKINTWDEELTRGAVFLKGLDDGLAPQAAAQRSRHAMLDYSQEGLTPVEQKYLSRIIFFYKFPRRAIPQGVRFSIEHPAIAMNTLEGERNEYGELIGPYFDNPIEAAFGGITDMVRDPVGQLAPPIPSLLDENRRTLRKALPPLDMAMRRLEDGQGIIGATIEGTPIPAIGMREGKDYAQRDITEKRDKVLADLELRMDNRVQPTPTQKFSILAEEAGLTDAMSMTKPQILNALRDELGLEENEVLRLLAKSERHMPPSKLKALIEE